MRFLVYVVVFLGLAWSAYWFVGSTAQKRAFEGWFAGQSANGWVAEYDELAVTGFPNRFDTVIEGLDLADPSTSWAWRAPRFQLYMLSYQPNKAIAVFPQSQTISTPTEKLNLRSETLRASVHLQPNTALGLAEAILEMKGLAIASTSGWEMAIPEGQLSVRRSPEGTAPDYGYDIALDATDFRLPDPLKNALDPAGLFPEIVTPISMRATPVYDRPWDRHAVEGETPVLTALNIQRLEITWGRLEIRLAGSLEIDEEGRPEGELNFVAKNWEDMLELAGTLGLAQPGQLQILRQGLGAVAEVTGETSTLDLPMVFEGGLIKLGFMPIGRAPVIVYRP